MSNVVHIPAGTFTVITDPSQPLAVTGTFAANVTFEYDGVTSEATWSTATPADNIGLPVVLLAGQAAGPIEVGAGSATASTIRTADAVAYERLAGSFIPAAFDYVGATYDTTSDTWTYKTGGASGTTVRTVLVTYTDSSKSYISSVAAS
jgi:hypothetical protein